MHYYYYYYLSYLYIYSYASQNMSPDVPMSRFYAQHGENKGLRWRDIALLWAGRHPSRCTQGLGRVGSGLG